MPCVGALNNEFQSTLLQEERQSSKYYQPLLQYFNPRSYKRSDADNSLLLSLISTISIHAPTRGATQRKKIALANGFISIHAPTRGATFSRHKLLHYTIFQSTLLQEERQYANEWYEYFGDFNPRSYKRSDSVGETNTSIKQNFNPRSYKRSDNYLISYVVSTNNFNPRSYKRSDSDLY